MTRSSAGNANWTVQYLDYWTDRDITAAVVGNGWVSPRLDPGGSCRLKVQMLPGAAVTVGQTCTVLLTGTSTIDATRLDVLGAVAPRR